MKKTVSSSAILLLLLILFFNAKCKKESPAPQLPPETTIGAMTFGCKINGRIFIPKDGNGKPGLYAQYINLGNDQGGGYFLNIGAADRKARILEAVRIFTDSLLLEENKVYSLKKSKGYPVAEYENYANGLNAFEMLSQDQGELIITKHAQRILSGRFWFDATNNSGEKVEVREGRFDIVY
jgi:hypothetical protein